MKKVLDKLKDANLEAYKSIPFWSWNAKLEPQELIKQIHWMKERGIGGFFMHARAGLKTEYMSDEWMECIEVCAKEAELNGMKAWAYDENGWPSGFAGGKLLENESNRDMYILTKIGAFDPAATVSYRLDNNKLLRVSEETCGCEDYLNLYLHVATSTADILNPDVVEQFISLTHEKYRERFGVEFAEKIEGFFTDEPQYYRSFTPYTWMINKHFKEVYKEDILDSLGLLFVEKEGYRSFRYRYWKGMQELMLSNFAKKIYEWCEKQNVKLTGHYLEESSLGYQLMCCGGIMPYYEYEHIPGIDWLAKRADNELAAKQVGSVAAQLGKKQVLSETFAGCGWDVTPWDLRRIAGFQYVNGVNLMCQHLIPYAEYGTRKHDYPAHFSKVNPWVEENFREFNNYFTRLGYLLGEGKENVNVAMLHPIRSAYFEYKREMETEGFGIAKLEEQFKQACRTLSGANIAYHFIDETLLKKYGFVEKNKIGCGNCKYDYLVLPSLYTMDSSTEELLRKYIMQGGKVLLLGEKPEYLEGELYDYSYITNTCTLEDIIQTQPYQVESYDTEIYSTFRTMEGVPFIYAINASEEKEFTQTFLVEGSLQKIDLITFETTMISNTITLKPGEDILMFIGTSEAKETKQLKREQLVFKDAEVSFEENYLILDKVRYSFDGKEFSEKWPVSALFQKFLEERVEGIVYLKYEFEVRELPENIQLRVEDSNILGASLNGISLMQTIPCGIEKNISAYDLAPHLRIGTNEYIARVQWHESEEVYYALFGENVTESMKNCIVYDSELEPLYLAGKFGVYPVDGYRDSLDSKYIEVDEFYVGQAPTTVSDFVKEGFPFLRGTISMKQNIFFETKSTLLCVNGFHHGAIVYVNGKNVGKLIFGKEIDVSEYAREGENEVEVRFLIGNQNLLGTFHFSGDQSGCIGPWTYELTESWDGKKSDFYHDYYKLRTFYQ